MKKADIKNLKISRKYASAIFETANKQGLTDKIKDDLVFAAETIDSNPQFEEFLKSPIVSLTDKKDALNRIFAAHIENISLDFLYLLIDNFRINALNEIINQYDNLYNLKNNIITVNIISAVELDSEQKQRINQKLEQKLSAVIKSEYEINEDIIGGIIVEAGDRTFDCSLRTKFNNMRKQLIKGNGYGSN